MILKYEEYKELNEEFNWKKNLAEWGLITFLIFNRIGGDVPRRYDLEWFKNYVSTNSVNNNSDTRCY